jgi:hypothetical protein
MRAHFEYIRPAIKDKRYFLKNGRPVFLVLKPFQLPDVGKFLNIWNEWIKEEGFHDGFYFVGHTFISSEVEAILEFGFDAVNLVRLGEHRYNKKLIIRLLLKIFIFKFIRGPLKINYSLARKFFIGSEEKRDDVIPTLIPNWDHTPRSGRNGVVFHGSTPDLFGRHAADVFKVVDKKNNKMIFVKSWNEWGEGNYLEPDLRFGNQFLITLKNAINTFNITTKQ